MEQWTTFQFGIKLLSINFQELLKLFNIQDELYPFHSNAKSLSYTHQIKMISAFKVDKQNILVTIYHPFEQSLR